MHRRDPYYGLWKELASEKAMVFISGPRQSGKTTLAQKIIAGNFANHVYFNWDVSTNKKLLIEHPAFFESANRKDASKPLVIFDEIHKYRRWKNYLKGIYDQYAEDYHFLVSGSGRLDISKRGGDALTGRFLEMHLFPLTLAELSKKHRPLDVFLKDPLHGYDLNPAVESRRAWDQLAEVSGFPEPFFKGRVTSWRRWSAAYGRQIVRDDIRSVEEIKRADQMEILLSLLPGRVASPLSMNNLAGDLGVSFETVKHWLTIFDHFYLTFRIGPWSRKISRAILKEKKMYLFNYPSVEDPSRRFENMAALELWRAVHQWTEWGWGDFALHYLRTKDKAETDFLITNSRRPILLVETKWADLNISASLKTFQDLLQVPAVQLVNADGILKIATNGRQKMMVVTAPAWLASLPC